MFSPAEIGSRIVADNQRNDHFTADPIFMVQKLHRIFGIDPEFTDNVLWQHGDEYTELPVNLTEACEAFYQDNFRPPVCIADGVLYGRGDDLPDTSEVDEYFSDIRRIGYYDEWDNVQPFFSQAGAERYIQENGHNLKKPRIYVECAYRNREWLAMRKHLIGCSRALELARSIERHCPCGARPESPNTHAHVPGCEVAELIQVLGGECATVAGNYQKAIEPDYWPDTENRRLKAQLAEASGATA